MRYLVITAVCAVLFSCTKRIFEEKGVGHTGSIKLLWKSKGAFNGISASYINHSTFECFQILATTQSPDSFGLTRYPRVPKDAKNVQRENLIVSKTGHQFINLTEQESVYLRKIKTLADSLGWKKNIILLDPDSLKLTPI